ncbi:MAG: efflux RND transporter periplasmic adaptor subunit [Thalassotalea sp.]
MYFKMKKLAACFIALSTVVISSLLLSHYALASGDHHGHKTHQHEDNHKDKHADGHKGGHDDEHGAAGHHSEGTEITEQMANKMFVTTEVVASRTLTETLRVYGKLQLPANAQRHLKARFPGQVKAMNTRFGEQVKKGQVLMTIESNESLQNYQIYAPISGLITAQNTAEGEQTGENVLLTITELSSLVAELNVFPLDQHKVNIGAAVVLIATGSEQQASSQISDALVHVNKQQAKVFRSVVDNQNGQFSPGQFVSADIAVASFHVPLAIKTSALQPLENSTVVFIKRGNSYQAQPVTLGRKAGDWVEVLAGIEVGSEYVSNNSYLIKADIEKSGASHDH